MPKRITSRLLSARLAHAFLTSTALVGAGPAVAQSVLPTSGHVVSGGATIGQPMNGALTITQSSRSAIVDWRSFSIGRQNRVDIAQPDSQSAILNRVTGSTPSTIAGQLNANGQVYLVNPNGISITKTGKVDAAGFVASTLGIADDDFKTGRRRFRGSGASAEVSNAGAITIGRGGYAALIGGQVSNSGAIVVPMGRIGLGSGERATLDLSGDGFLQVAVPTAAGGGSALVRSAGTISADGGSVTLAAASVRDAARRAVNLSGTIEARSVSGRNGSITLSGGDGAVAVSGRLDATGATEGGALTVTGRDIALTHAQLDVSGRTGGGSVRIGGGRQGKGPLTHAADTRIDAATTISADATRAGRGGDVVVWSDVATRFAGTISARGGAKGGAGGQAEVSSKGLLDYSGSTALTAQNGRFGTLLLDPYNVTISNGTNNTGGSYAATTNDSVINATTLSNQLGQSSVTITTGSGGSQAGNIAVAAPVAWSTPTLLTLTAANAMAINAKINVQGAGGLALSYNAASPTNLSFGSGASVDYGPSNNGGTLAINGRNYALVYSMTGLAGIGTSSSSYSALATDLTSTSSYTAAVVGGAYGGTFEGLGHTISNLTINDSTSGDLVGLFRYALQGTIRDIGLVGGSISATGSRSYVGALAGLMGQGSSSASVVNAYSTATVTGGDQSNAGGLIGEAYAYSGAPTLVANSYSTGTVTGGAFAYTGGLVGQQIGYYNSGANATITGSYATGTVTGGSNASVGGLVGSSSSDPHGAAVILNSYATGAVGGGSGATAGGLVGVNTTQTGVSSISGSFATGTVTGGSASTNGGLVGSNSGTGNGTGGAASITDSFATGAVKGGAGATLTGGLVGWNLGNGALASIVTSYATGRVTNGGYAGTGGLIGKNQSVGTGGSASAAGAAYYDMGTTGQSDTNGGSVGLTTALLQGRLPSGFSSSNWGTGAGLYPYLKGIFPNGVQAVSGTVYGDLGATPLASGSNGAVAVTVIGANTRLGTATTGANGYYYVFGQPGTIANGASLVAYTNANGTIGATNAGAIAASTYAAGTPAQSGVNVYEPVKLYAASTSAATLSASGYNPNATPAVPTGSTLPSFLTGAIPTLVATNSAGFTIDGTLDLTTGFAVQTTGSGAPITVANAVTLESGAALGLFAAGALTVNAPITAKGAVAVSLAYDQNTATPSVTDLAFAQGVGLSFVNTNGGVASSSAGGTLAINGTPYTLEYSLDALASAATGSSGAFALARNVDGSEGGAGYAAAPINSFSGTLEGLGHTINDLTITDSSAIQVGLIGTNSGTIRDIGLTGGSVVSTVTNGAFVGSLVGWNIGSGVVANAFSSATVSGGDESNTGGLVGFSQAYSSGDAVLIVNSYATGSVSAGANHAAAGGLVGKVGVVQGTSTVLNAYATGPVTVGDTGSAGGLVGWNAGDIQNAYATGAVTASGTPTGSGGLVGYLQAGGAINSYYDIGTTGQNNDPAGATGLTTAQLQDGASAAGLGSAFTLTSGLYPYLSSFFPTGQQAVSGFATKDGGATPLASGTAGAVRVSVIANANVLGTATTGANGYYYLAVPGSGALGSGLNLLAYTNANATTGATNSATLTTTTGAANQQGVNLYGNAVTVPTTQTSLTALGGFAGAVSTAKTLAEAADDSAHDAQASISGATGVGLIASGSSFAIDAPATTSGTFLVQTTGSGAPITVAAGSGITITNGGALGLYAAGALTIDANITVPGTGSVALAYDTNTTTASPADLSFAQGSSLSYTGTGGALAINGQGYTLLQTMTDVEGIASNANGRYALAADVTAITHYTDAFVSPSAGRFTGVFEGLGHTISDLTIDKTQNGNYAGLVGLNSGTIRDLGLLGGSIRGLGNVGHLAGENESDGLIVNAYATGTVSGNALVGGLVGNNYGSVLNAYATGAVSGDGTHRQWIGGLVGQNEAGGTIANAYAMGAVSGTSIVGGLVGDNAGAIANAYAAGSVSGNGTVGALVGKNETTGTVTNSAFDQTTTGQTYGIAYDAANGSTAGNVGATPLTTADLQSTATTNPFGTGSGFSGGAAGGEANVDPYLTSFFPNGVQAVSGIAHTGTGGILAAGQVGLYAGGTLLTGGTASTGANGYFYEVLPAGTLPASGVTIGATLTDPGATAPSGLLYTDAGTVSNHGLALGTVTEGLVTAQTSETTYGGLLANLGATFGTTTFGRLRTAVFPAAGDNLSASGAFTIDQAITSGNAIDVSAGGNLTLDADVDANLLNLTARGAIGQTGGKITATFLRAQAGTGIGLTRAGNSVGTLGRLQSTTGNVAFADSAGFTVSPLFNGDIVGTASGSLTLVSTGGGITLANGASLSATSALIAAKGAFANNAGSGALTTTNGFTIYTRDAANPFGALPTNTFGGLTATNWYNDAYSFTSSTFASPIPSGNHFVYAYQASLTPVLGGNASKVYDGTASAATGGLSVSATGFANANGISDGTPTFAIGDATFTGAAAVGTGKDVTVSGIALASNPNNYRLASTRASVAGAGAITPAVLTVTASNQTKTYGQTGALGTTGFTTTGLVADDAVTGVTLMSAGAAGTATVAGGPYAIIASSAVGKGLSNYTIGYAPGSLAVTPRSLVITADNQIRPANTANAPLLYTVGGLGLVNGDRLTGTLATTADEASPAGTYPITQGTLSASANYTLTYDGALLTVTGVPAEPTVPTVNASALASSVVRSLDDAGELPGSGTGASEPVTASEGGFDGLTDPRFRDIVVCVGGGAGGCFRVRIPAGPPAAALHQAAR